MWGNPICSNQENQRFGKNTTTSRKKQQKTEFGQLKQHEAHLQLHFSVNVMVGTCMRTLSEGTQVFREKTI